MTDHVSAVNSAVEAMDGLLDRLEKLDAITPDLRSALQRLANRSADVAGITLGEQPWDGVVLTDDEAFDSAPVPLIVTDPLGFVIRANVKMLELTETAPGTLLGMHSGDYIHSDDYDFLADIWVRMQVETDFNTAITEFRLLLPRGARWVRGAIRASRNDDLSLANLVVHFTDVDDKHAVEQALDRSSRKFGDLLDSLPDPIVRVNRAFEVQFANPAARQYRNLGRYHEWPRVTEENRAEYLEVAERCWATGESTTFEHSMLAGDDVLWCESTFVPEVGPSSKVETLLVIWRDQTTRRRHEELLAYRATHDALTGLPNRARFSDLLEVAVERQVTSAELGQKRPIAVLFLDLDRFKFVNDSLGHLAGDDLLKNVAERLTGAIRPGDVIGRLGGDEFTILAEDISREDAVMMAERILERLKEPFMINGREFISSASIGVVSSETPAGSTDLMRWADSAMYRAKGLGRSRVATYEEVLAPEVMDQLELDQMIRSAAERGELELYYQPEVLIATSEIVGVEALLRWHHPTKGLLGAERFIPVAEDNGMIVPIGAWVLRQACEQVSQWIADGLAGSEFMLRVNLSPRQMDRDGLPMVITETLEETGIRPTNLCLEITETSLMSDTEHTQVSLEDLASVGITLAVDDFGTGYSSLSSLKRFPIDVLKIDKSFISGMTKKSRDEAIVRTVITLSDTLNLTPTAEGVETEDQRALLEEMGCPRGQGFLFSRPVPADEFAELLRDGIPSAQPTQRDS